MNNVIEVDSLTQSYGEAGSRIAVLKGVNFTVAPGQIVAIIGASGSGKSTLLHAIGGLDAFDSGSVTIAGHAMGTLSEHDRGLLRNRYLGFVYQFHHLQPEFSALENVAMPLIIRREARQAAFAAARAVLTDIGLGDRIEHLPSQLSGGERQRVAIARAIVTQPACVLADEPTGNLDEATAKAVFTHLVRLARQKETAIVIVTHDKSIAAACDRTLVLEGGKIHETAPH